MADQLSTDLAALRIQRDVDPDRKSPLKTALVTLVLLAAVGAGVAFAYPKLEAKVFKAEVATTEVLMVSPAQASVTLTSTGYVVPQVVSHVGAKLAGRVSKVFIKEGDVVKAGQVLVELEDADQKSSIAAAGSRVAVARARAEAARASLSELKIQADRERVLVEKGATARAGLDDLVAKQQSLAEQVKAAEAEIRSAQSEVEVLRTGLKDHTVVAPIDGTVISKPISVGELVGMQLATQTAIVELADFSSIVVETDIPEARLSLVKVGSPCEIVLDAYPSKRYRGKVAELGKRVDRAKGTVTIKVQFVDSMEGVLPDMSARTSFLTEELSAEAMKEAPKRVVPSSAVADRNGGKVVFVLEGDKVKSVPVQLGGQVGSGFELLSGPAPGTRLVANPSPELSEGQRVKEKGADG